MKQKIAGGGNHIKPDQVKSAVQPAVSSAADASLSLPTPSSKTPGWQRYLKWEARIALIIGSVGWLVALHGLNRVWQALAGLFSWQIDGLLDRPTPFDALTSPTPLFPVLMLALWLQGALALFWLNQSSTSTPISNKAITFRVKGYVFWILIALGLGLALGIGWLERAAQLLPDTSGHLPASNYDEMVYFSGSALISQGYVPYHDFFLAHPPGAELLYSVLLKLFGATAGTGGYNDFLLARWGAIGLGLLTIVGVAWVGGRLWAREKGFAWGPGIAAALLYAADARAAGVATLETPANFCAACALGCYFEAGQVKQPWLRRGLWLGSGILLAFSVLCKLPGAALVFAWLVYLPIKKQWRELGWLSGGFIGGGIIALGPFVLRAGPGEVLRQVVLFQLMRPQEVREGLDEIGRLADYPNSALTIWLSGLALALIAVGLLRGKKDQGRWLVPALWSLPLLVVFTLSKSFHPWYYVQWALPLALLGAGLFSSNLWPEIEGRWLAGKSWLIFRGVLSLGLIVIGGPLLLAQWQEAGRPDIDKVYRPAGAALQAEGTAPVLVFDPGYSFMAGRLPARLPATGKFMVDSAGYMVYLNLDMDRRSLFDLLGAGLSGGRERGQVDALFRRDRAQALVVEGITGAGDAVLDGKLALPQLTPRSVEFIGTTASQTGAIEYADLYRVRPLDVRRSWRFDNGLRLTPFGLSTSLAGRANADPVEPGEIIRLSPAEAGRRSLDLRFVWRVDQTPAQPVKMFVHLLNDKGQRVAQRDSAPFDDKADTRQWRTGDAYQDVYSLPLPANLAPGRYQVEVGIYDAGSGTRFTTEGHDSLTIGYLIIN
jgi:hypothetical protein